MKAVIMVRERLSFRSSPERVARAKATLLGREGIGGDGTGITLDTG
jgi:hypothetical protein